MSDELDPNLDEQRHLVRQILDNSGKRALIKQCVENSDIVLKPDLEISCNVGAQTDVLSILQVFNPLYLRLVLEAVLKIRIDYTTELNFMEALEKIAHKHVFHSSEIAKNKKYVYTRGNWLTEEGKKAVERHFLLVVCQTFYLMEQCVVQRVIPDGDRMFKPETSFSSMHDVFSFISRELIGGKTLFPKVMENIGFKPSHHDPTDDLNHSSFIRPCQSNCGRSHNQSLHSTTENYKTTPSSVRKVSVQPQTVENKQDRIQKLLFQEAQDSRVGELFNLIDQTDMNSFMNQTQATVDNIEKHVRGLTDYQSNIQALYDQLKHTAKFLADIVHSLGLDETQIELIMQKINELQLNIQETGELSAQLAGETQQIVNELSAFSMRIEQTLRTSIIEPVQSSFVDGIRSNNKALDSLIAKNNAEFSEKEARLQSEINVLQDKVENIRLKKEDFEGQVDVLTKDKESVEQQLDAMTKAKEDFEEKYANAMKLLAERDNELEDRENVVEKLRIEAGKQKLPTGLEKEIEEQLQSIYNTMSDVTNRVHEN